MWIYMIKCQEDNLYYIGNSRDPGGMVKRLQEGNPQKLILVEKFESQYANKIKMQFHNRYSHVKKEGAWFVLDLKDEVEFIINCSKAENNFKFLEENKI